MIQLIASDCYDYFADELHAMLPPFQRMSRLGGPRVRRYEVHSFDALRPILPVAARMRGFCRRLRSSSAVHRSDNTSRHLFRPVGGEDRA